MRRTACRGEALKHMPKINSGDIFSGLPSAKKREVFQTLARGNGFRIERIVSCGQATPQGRWLCSKTAEWVIVLRGRARLRFQGGSKGFDLRTGEHVLIPPDVCHRVEWTQPRQRTVWLAVHFKTDPVK